ncbi:MAG: anion permease [Propionibacteriaceae bacterium]|nr:anion permease [Propionibacteriaceae bacterium]
MSTGIPASVAGDARRAGTHRFPGIGETRLVPLGIAVVVGLLLWLIPVPSGLAPNAWHLVAVFVATIVAIIGKAAPMGSISIMAMAVCAASRILAPGSTSDSISAALSGFSNSTIWLIVSAFFIARAVIKSGLGERLAYFFVRIFGRSALGLAYGLGLADLVLSPAIPSNTARSGGVVYPIMRSVIRTTSADPDDPEACQQIGSYLTLATYNLDLAASVVFLTGAAPNAMGVRLAAASGADALSWGGWFLAASVPGLLGFVAVPLILHVIFPPAVRHTPEAPAEAARRLRELGPLSGGERMTLGAFVLIIVLWVIGDRLMSATTVALIGLGVLLLTGALTWDDMKSEKSAWDTLTWFAALVMMGTYLNELGFIGWFGDLVREPLGGLSPAVAFVALALVYAVSHYMFASGTAHAASMFGVFFGVGTALGLPSVPLIILLSGIPTLMGCLTHYGNGPAPLFFGTGYVRIGQWWRNGLIIGIVHMVIWLTVGTAWWHLVGVW